MIALRLGTVLGALLVASTHAAAMPADLKQWVDAGPLWNQQDAEGKCPKVAYKAGGKWTGQWKTTVPGQMSVCEVAMKGAGQGGKQTVEVGPIWNQMDAERKCPQAASAAGGKWTGQWWTTQPGRMSVCEVKIR
jgi:hypothetical protein